MSRYLTSSDPFREVLRELLGKEPPPFVRGYDVKGLSDAQMSELQDWCSLNAKPHWATGLAMIEAAELIIAGAISNGNISIPSGKAK